MAGMLSIYAFYFVASICMTIWVAQTLHKNGRVFLLDVFSGRPDLADSVNHLLMVGFYLVNIGFILLYLRAGDQPETAVDGVEYVASKLGFVILILGAMHFTNLLVFSRMRKKHAKPEHAKPVVHAG